MFWTSTCSQELVVFPHPGRSNLSGRIRNIFRRLPCGSALRPSLPGSGDDAFRACTKEIILPLLEQFKPEALLISYGFDPHWMDPLGHLQLSAACYGKIISLLTDWADQNCNGKICLFLEGGYSLEAAAACSLSIVYKMLGREWEDSLGKSPRPEGLSWRSVIKMARDFWNL